MTKSRTNIAVLLGAALLGLAGAAQAVEYEWSSGRYTATGLPNPLLAGDVIHAVGAGAKVIDTRLQVAGTLNWRSAAAIDIASTAGLRVDGLLDVSVDGVRVTYGGGATFDVAGRVVKSAGPGELLMSAPFTLRSAAVMDSAAGTIRYTAGGLLEDGSVFSGAGLHVLAGANTSSGTFNVGGRLAATAGRLQMASGIFSALPGRVAAVDGDLSWTGGTLIGDWLNPAGRTLTAGAGLAKQVGDLLANEGRLVWASSDDLVLSLGGAEVRNAGTLEFVADARVRAVNTGAVDNRGRLAKLGGDGDLRLDVPVYNRAGARIEAARGTVRYRNGGLFENGSGFTGAGEHVFEGPNANSAGFRFVGELAAPTARVRMASGIFGNGGSAPVRLETDLAFSGGSFTGGWLNPAGRTLSVQAGLAKSITGVFTNEGRVEFATTDTVVLSGSSRFDNAGTLDFVADGRLTANNVGSVVNTGVIRKSAGNGTAWISQPLTNRGVIESLSGTLRVVDGWTNQGQLSGTATFRSSRITNAGLVSAGIADGPQQLAVLTFDGALANAATGVLDFELAEGGLSDQLWVAGAMSFDGSLRLSPYAGYEARLGDRFQLMGFASATGRLDEVLAVGFGDAIRFEAIYEPTALWVEVTAVPEPAPWLLLAAGLAVAGLRRRA